jgi:hypothetical protein
MEDINSSIIKELSQGNLESVFGNLNKVDVKAINKGTLYGNKTFVEHILTSEADVKTRVQMLKEMSKNRVGFFKTPVDLNAETKSAIPRDPLLSHVRTLDEAEVLVKNGINLHDRMRVGDLILNHLKIKAQHNPQSTELLKIIQYLEYKGAPKTILGESWVKTKNFTKKSAKRAPFLLIGAYAVSETLQVIDHIKKCSYDTAYAPLRDWYHPHHIRCWGDAIYRTFDKNPRNQNGLPVYDELAKYRNKNRR